MSCFFYDKKLHDFMESKGIKKTAYGPLNVAKKFDNPEIVKLAEKYKKKPA